MKNKPLRHKETNVFKFIPFYQRLSKVKINPIHKIKHKYELEGEEETSCHLYEAYKKWIVLNGSESFQELRRDIPPHIQTLALVVHQKDTIADVLKKHLAARDPLNLQPTLEFVVAFAHDLSQQFYQLYFPAICELLVSLLNSRDVDQLEWVFECFAYLFKLLWRYMIEDLPLVFEYMMPLLDKSKPAYVNKFAAHSFAFVARKVRDDCKLINLLVSACKDKPQVIEGCGHLLFATVHGWKGEWHSSGEKIFRSVISALRDPSYPHAIVCELLSLSLSHLLGYLTEKPHIQLLWRILQTSLTDFWKELSEEKTDRTVVNVEQVLCMIQQAVEYKKCSALVKPAPLSNQLVELLASPSADNLITRTCSILSYILVNAAALPQELSSSTVIGALGNLEGKTLLEFAFDLRSFSGFEGIVLPRLLKYCLESISPEVALPYLSRLVASKAPLPVGSRELLVFQPYSFNFTSTSKVDPATYCNFYINILKERTVAEHLEHFDDCIMILQILPHLLPLPKSEAVRSVVSLLEAACGEAGSVAQPTARLLYLVCATLEAIMCLKPQLCITKLVSPTTVLPTLIKFASDRYFFVLRVLDFYVSLDELNLVQPFAEELKSSLHPQLMSPYQKVRLHASHILYEVEKSGGSNPQMASVLETCWSCESIPPTLSEYRQRLKVLRNLDCDTNQTLGKAVATGNIDGRVALRYLLGHLYINFKLLWEPVFQIIMSYSCTMEPAQFWEVYHQQMDNVTAQICDARQQQPDYLSFACKGFEDIISELNDLKETPDHIKYRIMLWDLLKRFPYTICEGKSKDIVISFFKFMDEEYNKRYSEVAITWNIRLKGEGEQVNVSMQDIDLLMEIDEEAKEELMDHSTDEQPAQDEEIKKKLTEEPLPETDYKTKWLTKSLVALMGVFGKIRSPKSLYREPELNKIFHEFLSSRVTEVQKGALDFMMQYKYKYLTPYKDNVYGLIDDKTFKNELTLFRVDTQSDVVKAEHRTDLIPIILRLVYSKMNSKVNSSKRETKQARKAAILRFLSGCSSEELFNFFKMTFHSFVHLLEDDASAMVDKISNSFDLERCTPPRRLTATVHLLKSVLTYCGGLLDATQASFILRLILVVAAHLPPILSKREEVHPGYIKVIKNVRAVCFHVMSQFYEVYVDYNWSEGETNAVFKVLVWPYLHNLQVEAVNSPTTQFKLFNVWTKNIKYLGLLDRKDKDGRSILSTMMGLWTCPKLHGSVYNTLLELVCRILATEDEETEAAVGKELLSNYFPTVLRVLQNKLSSKKALTKRELYILSVVTSTPTENISAECLLSFVIPSLLKSKSGKKDDQEVTQLLTSALNLVQGVADSGPYLKQIVPLYSSLAAPQHRKLLLSLTLLLSERSGSPVDEEILMDLTAWDAKWLEQPDFTRRLKAFSALSQPTVEPTIVMAAIVIHTAFFYMQEEKDLSMKDNARHCLQILCPRVCNNSASDKAAIGFILNDTLFPLISKGINSKVRSLRQEAILILGHMVRECSSLHYVFSDLLPLSCKSDQEVDFFENLVHLQLHRRVRAMLRFSAASTEPGHSWNPHTLMDYVYPMIYYFLHSPKYAEKNTIIDSAITAMGSICRLLPWKYYSHILRFYLGKLKSSTEFQKQNIRVVSEILNAFHFDLSKAENFNNKNLKSEETAAEDGTVETEKDTTESVETTAKDETDETKDKTVEVEMEIALDEEKEKTTDPMGELVLNKPAAEKVVTELVKVILPALKTQMARSNVADSYHKVNKKNIIFEKDEEDILRAPLAIAIVKLLQKLPSDNLLNRNLPGVLMKLCNLLKSHGESVRRTTRTTLKTVMMSLGPKHLPTLLSELVSLLTRGFHVHVLTYTVHGVLKSLEPMYAKGDLDSCVHQLLQVSTTDLFGAVAEEKEVNQITAKTVEARVKRSYDIFRILATFVSEGYLLNILLPLKEELSKTVSHESMTKVAKCLQQVALGLTDNQFVKSEELLQLAYGVTTESIPALLGKQVVERDPKQVEFESRRGPDIYLIPPEPKQKKALMSSECSKTNAHLLVEFGLSLLYFLLKREKLKMSGVAITTLLDPLVIHLLECIGSQHVKVCTLAVRCIPWLIRLKLPAISINIKRISQAIFQILHRFASTELSKGDNFDLVLASFKCMSAMVRYLKSWSIVPYDKERLLLYCKQDMNTLDREATALSLLDALLDRHIPDDALLQSVMDEVAFVSLKSSKKHVMEQARRTMRTYLMEIRPYKKEGKIDEYLWIYLDEDNAIRDTMRDTRESCLLMNKELISCFPKDRVESYSGNILLQLSCFMAKERDSDLLQLAFDIVILLIEKVDSNVRDKLFQLPVSWIGADVMSVRKVGMIIVGLYIAAEKKKFASRIEPFFELVVKDFTSKFEERIVKDEEEEDQKAIDRRDEFTKQAIWAVIDLFNMFPETAKDDRYKKYVDVFEEECTEMLAHPYIPVRTLSLQLLFIIKSNRGTTTFTKNFVLDVVYQLEPRMPRYHYEETVKMLGYIVKHLPSSSSSKEEPSLHLLARRMRSTIPREIKETPEVYEIRTSYLDWAAELAQNRSSEHVRDVAPILLVPIVKMQSEEDKTVVSKAKHTASYFRVKLGQAEYNEMIRRISASIETTKAVRKVNRAQLAVTDPERAAKRKINKQLKKKVLKKKKMQLIKENKFVKKKKKTEFSVEDDD